MQSVGTRERLFALGEEAGVRVVQLWAICTLSPAPLPKGEAARPTARAAQNGETAPPEAASRTIHHFVPVNLPREATSLVGFSGRTACFVWRRAACSARNALRAARYDR